MGRIFQTTLGATRPSIAAAAEDLANWLDAERVPEPAALLARLALDELATNLAMHGAMPGGGDPHSVHVECRATPEELLVHVDDDGPAFNPLEVRAPDLDGPLEGRRVGGLGIHLLRELSDRFEYERNGGRNRITLAKKLGA